MTNVFQSPVDATRRAIIASDPIEGNFKGPRERIKVVRVQTWKAAKRFVFLLHLDETSVLIAAVRDVPEMSPRRGTNTLTGYYVYLRTCPALITVYTVVCLSNYE